MICRRHRLGQATSTMESMAVCAISGATAQFDHLPLDLAPMPARNVDKTVLVGSARGKTMKQFGDQTLFSAAAILEPRGWAQ